MSEPLTGYAEFYLEVIDAVVATLEKLKPEFLKTVVFGELEGLPDPNMMPAAFVIPRADAMTDGTTAKTKHAITVDTVVLHRHNLVEGSIKPSLPQAIILAGKCYDTIIADRSLGGKVRLVGGNRRFEPDYMFGTRYDTDVVVHGLGEDKHGIENWKQYVSAMWNAFPDLHLTFDDRFVEKDKVVTRFTFTGTHKGEFMGAPPTNKKMTWWVIEIMRIADGKIVESWMRTDTLGFMQQLGVVPTPKKEK